MEKRQPEEQEVLGIAGDETRKWVKLERVKGKARGCYISPEPLRRGDTGRGLLAGDAIDPRQK